MRALRWHGRRDVRVDDVEPPLPPGPHEVTVSVEWSGICGTDVEEYLHGPLLVPVTPHPLTGASAPLTLGHEVVGRVSASGAGSGVGEGTLVALDGYYFCGTCDACRRHDVNQCETWAHIGLSAPGGLAEAITVPARMVFPATTDIASDALALAEPFSVAVRAVRRGHIVAGERVCVVGGGTIGLAVAETARVHAGADVVVVEAAAGRRDLAALATQAAVVPSLLAAGEGYDAVIDCTGSVPALSDALAALRRGGRLVAVGIVGGPATLDYRRVVLEELTIIGSVGHVYDEDFARAVELICDRSVDPAPFVTHRIALDEAVTEGFDRLADPARSGTALKILVHP